MADSSQTRLIGTTTHSHRASKHGPLRAASAVHHGMGNAAPEKGHCRMGRAAGCEQVDPALTPCCFLSTCQTRGTRNNTPLHKETVTLRRRDGAWKALPAAPGGPSGQHFGSAAALPRGSATPRPRPSPPGATRSSAGTPRIPPWERRGRSSPGDGSAAMGARRGALSDVRPSRPPAARCRLRPRPPSCPQSVSRWEGTSPALTHGDGGCGDSGGQEAGPGRASTAAPSGRPARSPGAVCADRRRPVPARRLSRRGSCARTRRPAISISPER